MTNSKEPQLTEAERIARRMRPPAYFDDFSFESRGIEKIADALREQCEELYASCIDPEFNPGWNDEESEAFIENRVELLVKMACISLLGSDRVVI